MARKSGSIKTFPALWQNHENLYFSIFSRALNQLKVSDKLRKDEDAISEALCPILARICFKKRVKKPDWEKPIPPVANNDLKGGKTQKIPDFSCSLLNSFANNVETCEISFHVECKRLGKTVGSWNLNKNYVANGVKRFDIKSHEYGKSAPSGLMIGYIVNMEPNTILNKVNAYLGGQFPKLNFGFSKKTASCIQNLIRKEVKPEQFKLIHLWADYRLPK